MSAYYTATTKGTDVDQPRNLAKSVTVECRGRLSMAERIIVTGGAGYIGSHVCVDRASRHRLLIIDDFSNSSPEAVAEFRNFAEGDIRLLEVRPRRPGAARKNY
ncbi:MAG: NAD-dependent epimerase/dehydratase family protein [Parvularculaceae bacterium]